MVARKCVCAALLSLLVLRSCTSPVAALTWQSSWTGAPSVMTTGAGIAQPVRHSRRAGAASPTSVRPLQGQGSEAACDACMQLRSRASWSSS